MCPIVSLVGLGCRIGFLYKSSQFSWALYSPQSKEPNPQQAEQGHAKIEQCVLRAGTTHVTLPPSSRASCLCIVSLGAHSQVVAVASCLCLSPGYDGAHMVHPLAWPTQLLGSPASPQRAGRWVVTLDPGKRQMDILLLVDTTIEGASPSHARQE